MPPACAIMHNPPMFEWSDLRYFLAVARHGSTLAAGKHLHVSQSTVQRRLLELERRIGRKLVERLSTGYRLTTFGQEMLPHAERVEEAVMAFAQHPSTMARAESGVIRLTCPEPIMYRLTQSQLLDRFHARHPTLRIEFVMSDKYLDLEKGEADVALRSGDTDGIALVGRKVADSLWGVYASQGYVARRGRPEHIEDIAHHAVVGLDGSLADHRAATWLRSVAPKAEIVARSTSVLGLVSAVKSGVGLAPLPTALGDAEPDLLRLLGPIDQLTRSWRILTHRNLRRSPRISAFFNFVQQEIRTLRPILTG